MDTDEPPRAPIITTQPRNVRVSEGGIIEMTCVAEGSPYPHITWWNNNRIVSPNSRVSVSNSGQHLRIQDIELYDAGDYTCLAENSVGRRTVTASITVISDGNVLPQGYKFTDHQFQVSETIVESHEMSATRGSTVQIPCPHNDVIANVVWEKDGDTMAVGGRHRVGSDGSLVIYNVDDRDGGEYDCVMSSDNRHKRMVRTLFHVINNEEQLSSNRNENGGYSGHTGRPSPIDNVINEIEVNERYDTDLSYDVGGDYAGDRHVAAAIEEARRTVDSALNHTVSQLFEHRRHTNTTPAELLNIFRYPSASERELARAGEIYLRTLELVEAKVAEGGQYNLSSFSVTKLISPANLELIGNLSGCEAARRSADCSDLCHHAKYRSMDGSCNNHVHSLWGASLTPLKRLLPPQYENGFNTPIGQDPDKLYNGFRKPNARLVSRTLVSDTKVDLDPDLSQMLMQWGQFLDHDIDHSMEAVSRETFRTGQTCGATCSPDPPCFPIMMPEDDSRPGQCMEFTRSSPTCGSGSTSVFFEDLQQREQVNRLTSFIDASQVYGSDSDFATSLRNLTNDFGRLREGITYDYGKPLLPFNDGHPIDCRRDPRDSDIGCFLAGDVRANEQLGLLTMHTLWLREHNRLAEQLRSINPHWDGDKVYQEARAVVWASMQHITYQHWLPLVIGPSGMEMLGQYQGYNAGLDPSVSNVFATAAMRFGHTIINPVIRRLDERLQSIPEGDLPLHQAFFSPWRLVEEGGMDPVLRGLIATPAKYSNQGLADDLTERLFSVAHTVALDLAALNIQRGRDHGLPGYTAWLHWCGLTSSLPVTWAQLTQWIPDTAVVDRLRSLYGHPDNIDVWVGSILERRVEGGRVGPTAQCILVDQFRRLRAGDRFWYENPEVFSRAQLDQLRQVTLARLFCDNGDNIQRVASDVFKHNTSSWTQCDKVQKMSLNPWTGKHKV